jgi:uncharacterized protein YdeI (YjbR/CyaY-like superfamily)
MEIIECADVQQWESWLAGNHHRTDGVWVKIAKKGAARQTLTIREALDGALCFGWIDSQRKKLDDEYYLQRYSPRRANAAWSQVNVDKVEALLAAGRMREPGLAAVAAAKEDGRWAAAYAPQRTATMPDDLADALAGDARARAAFDQLDRTGQYALYLRLMKARLDRTTQLHRIMASLGR